MWLVSAGLHSVLWDVYCLGSTRAWNPICRRNVIRPHSQAPRVDGLQLKPESGSILAESGMKTPALNGIMSSQQHCRLSNWARRVLFKVDEHLRGI